MTSPPAHTDAELTLTSPGADSKDAAWVTITTPFIASELAELCHNLETLYRVNPCLTFRSWQTLGNNRYHAEYRNLSNNQEVVVDMTVVPESGYGFTVEYGRGIKKRTMFVIEAAGTGSRLVITDDYEHLSEEERTKRLQEVDKSLAVWGEGLHTYFKRFKRWSWLAPWRWYMRRLWIPMTPSARRITWMITLITAAEFVFFLLVLAIYLVEQGRTA